MGKHQNSSAYKDQKQKIIEYFAQSEKDTGSPEVQIALLTWRINRLSEHLQKHPHDYHSRRGFIKLISKRRALLNYLKLLEEKRYKDLVKKLGLRE